MAYDPGPLFLANPSTEGLCPHKEKRKQVILTCIFKEPSNSSPSSERIQQTSDSIMVKSQIPLHLAWEPFIHNSLSFAGKEKQERQKDPSFVCSFIKEGRVLREEIFLFSSGKEV